MPTAILLPPNKGGIKGGDVGYETCDDNTPFRRYDSFKEFDDDYQGRWFPEVYNAVLKRAEKEGKDPEEIWREMLNKHKQRYGSEYNVREADYEPYYDMRRKRQDKVNPYEPTYVYGGNGEYYDYDDGYYDDDDFATERYPSSKRLKHDRR